MTKWAKIYMVCMLLFAVARAHAGGSFLMNCAWDHSRADDPIVLPRSPGASHLHDFIGAHDTNAFSSYVSMQTGGTSCRTLADTAGYWTPALYRNGVQIKPGVGTGPTGIKTRMRIYYNRTNLASGTRVEVPPRDLRVIAGNSHAMSPSENLVREVYWGCSDNSTGKLAEPPPSCPTGIISLHVGFPNCWDGVLTHNNDTAHLVYPKSGVCPSSHPHVLPRVIFRWEYAVGTDTGTITLSSGPAYTAHGDWWNTWDQATLTWLVEACINGGVSCGTL